MRIDNTTQIENPIITLSWSWQNPNILVSAKYENERNSYGRQIGQFTYINGWQWQPNEGNTTDVNEYFKDLAIEDLNIKNLDYYAPPTPTSKGVIIPEKYSWVFKNNRFELNNFVVEFQTIDNELVVDTSYIFWEAFKTELDKPENITVKDSLMPVWDYVIQQIIIDNTIDL
jgi:hypothetical protein